jgi:hypothetical protein
VELVLGELYPPQETAATLAAKRTIRPIVVLFKPGTPNHMRDKDLDARNRIIAERFLRYRFPVNWVLS